MKNDVLDMVVNVKPRINVEEISVQYRNGIGFLMCFSPTGGPILFRSDLWIMKDMVISGFVEKFVYNHEPHKGNKFNPEDYWISESTDIFGDLRRMTELAQSITQEDFDVLWAAGRKSVCRNPKAMCHDRLAPIMRIENTTELLRRIGEYLQEPLVTIHQEDVMNGEKYVEVLSKYQNILKSM